jgi:hypothetical protein
LPYCFRSLNVGRWYPLLSADSCLNLNIITDNNFAYVASYITIDILFRDLQDDRYL